MRVYLLSLIIGKWMVKVFCVFAVGFAVFSSVAAAVFDR